MSKRRFFIVAAVAMLPLAAIVVLIFVSAGSDPYPNTPAGWNARLDAHLADFGATRGENWPLWLEVASELQGMIDSGFTPTDEDLKSVLGRIEGVERFIPPYETHPDPDIFEIHYSQTHPATRAYQQFLLPRLQESLRAADYADAATLISYAEALRRPLSGTGFINGFLTEYVFILEIVNRTAPVLSTSVPQDAQGLESLQSAFASIRSSDPEWFYLSEREWGLPLVADTARAGWPIQARSQIGEYDRLLTDASNIANDPAALDRIKAFTHRLDTEELFPRRRVALEATMPAIERTWPLFQALTTQRNGMIILIALTRHRAVHGHYPATLDELDPAILDTLPEDPFASDKRFVYRVLDETAERPIDAIHLYSVGANAVDDGGVHDPESKPFYAHGTGDFVFTYPPRPESPPADDDSEDAASEPEDHP